MKTLNVRIDRNLGWIMRNANQKLLNYFALLFERLNPFLKENDITQNGTIQQIFTLSLILRINFEYIEIN